MHDYQFLNDSLIKKGIKHTSLGKTKCPLIFDVSARMKKEHILMNYIIEYYY